jgi:hypothetical protein
MADSAFHIVGRWAAAALCAVAVSLVHAKPPHAPRAGFAAPGAGSGWRAPSRGQSAFVMSTNPYRRGSLPRAAPAPAFGAPPTPFRPVSEEARTLAREGGAAYLRAGSIRADIARYNEERGAPRPPRPPNGGARSPEPAPVYRN